MAIVPGSATIFDTAIAFQDLEDYITNISPYDTPVMDTVGRRKCTQYNFEWAQDTLATVNANNAYLDGFQFTGAVVANTAQSLPALKQNITQLSQRNATITGGMQATRQAGTPDPMGYQVMKSGRDLRRDQETSACSPQPQVAGSDTIARNTEGLAHFILNNVYAPNVGGGGTAFVAGALTGQTTADTQALYANGVVAIQSFTETDVTQALTDIYNAGGAPTTMFVDGYNKGKLSRYFSGRVNSRVMVPESEVVNHVDVYSSDFGDLNVHPSRFIDTYMQAHSNAAVGQVLIIDPDHVKMVYLRNYEVLDMAIVGDSKSRLILADWGVQCSAPDSCARIVQVGTSTANDPTPTVG